jgi:hypothetical protein
MKTPVKLPVKWHVAGAWRAATFAVWRQGGGGAGAHLQGGPDAAALGSERRDLLQHERARMQQPPALVLAQLQLRLRARRATRHVSMRHLSEAVAALAG